MYTATCAINDLYIKHYDVICRLVTTNGGVFGSKSENPYLSWNGTLFYQSTKKLQLWHNHKSNPSPTATFGLWLILFQTILCV